MICNKKIISIFATNVLPSSDYILVVCYFPTPLENSRTKSKSIRFNSKYKFMKNISLMLLFVLTNSCAQKQSNYAGFEKITHDSQITILKGKWRISALIANSEAKEYLLSPQSPNRYENYGNNISINPDQTFISGYIAECGNDCFTTTKGKYKILDENYICFYIEEIIQSGECSENSKPNKDLGLYYYYKTEKGFRLVRSSGNLEQDKKNVNYYNLIVAKKKEVEEFYYRDGENQLIYNWKQTNLKDEKEVVAFCMTENKIKEYEILSSYNFDPTLKIILVKINNQFGYVLYDTWGNPMVSLYNDSNIKKIDGLVKGMDNDVSIIKTVKRITNPKNTSESKVITIFKKDGEINKVIYAGYYKYSEKISVSVTTIYLQNSTPILVVYLVSPDQEKEVSVTGLYVLDWQNNKGANKIIKHENGKNNKYLVFEKPKINKIIEEIKMIN